MKWTTFILIFLLVAGCSRQPNVIPAPDATPSSAQSEASYADYINFDGRHYINAWQLAVVDTAGLTEIGEVESGYAIQEGAAVYEIAGYPDHDVVAVKAVRTDTGIVTNMSGYLVYAENGISPFPELKDDQVQRIRIYRSDELIKELGTDEVSAFLDLFNRQGPHNEFLFDNSPRYTLLFTGDQALGTNYGVIEKEGQFGLAHIESKLPDEIASYFK